MGGRRVCPLLSLFHFTVVFGSPTILLFSTRLFELLLFLCILFSSLVSFLSLFCHSALWCHFVFSLILSVSLFCLPSYFCLRRSTHTAPPGFLSWLSALHKLKKWYICYKSFVKHRARHLVQSEPHSITQISHRASPPATHRQPDPRLV